MENGDGRGNPINVEIIAVGRQFLEPDYRWLYPETRKAPFCRHTPLSSAAAN